MTANLSSDAKSFLKPGRLYKVYDIVADASLVPKASGIYGWWFSTVPPGAPAVGTLSCEGKRLLYVGIAPRSSTSRKSLRDRLTNHCRGPLGSSTLRRTLACLLYAELGLTVSRRASGKVYMARSDEARLSDWMNGAAQVAWWMHPKPWEIEAELLAGDGFVLPLNIAGAKHPFSKILKELRSALGQ